MYNREKLLELFEKHNAHGIGLGKKTVDGQETDEICVVFYVDEKKSISNLTEKEIVPKNITLEKKQYGTDVLELKKPELLGCCDTRYTPGITNRNRIRPIKGGISIGNIYDSKWFTGTLGLICIDQIDNSIVGLTNVHVTNANQLNNLNNSKYYNTFNKQMTQPSYPDAVVALGPPYELPISNHISQTSIGIIKRFWPITTKNNNIVDCSLISISQSNGLINNTSFGIHGITDNIIPWATEQEIENLTLGTLVQKSGRSTGLTGTGYNTSPCKVEITSLNYSFPIIYSETEVTFQDTIQFRYTADGNLCNRDIVSPIDGGDSGSILIANIGGVEKIIGLNFAGSTQYGIACKINNVKDILKVRQPTASDLSNLKFSNPNNWKYIAIDKDLESDGLVNYKGKEYWQIGNIPYKIDVPDDFITTTTTTTIQP